MLVFYRSLLLAFIICFSASIYAEDYPYGAEAVQFYDTEYDVPAEYSEYTERDVIIRDTLDYIEFENEQVNTVPSMISVDHSVASPRTLYLTEKPDNIFFDQPDKQTKHFPLDPPVRSGQRSMMEEKIWERTLLDKNRLAVTAFCKLGYLFGNTTYDYAHHTSELEYPFDNWMWGIGGTVSAPQYRLSLRAQVMSTIEANAGDQMKDKDWITPGDGLDVYGPVGELWSYTRSNAYMRGTIIDISAKYDLAQSSRGAQRFRGSLIGGYRYQKFVYEMYGALYKRYLPLPAVEDMTLYPNTKVLGYQIHYYIPYAGFSCDIEDKRWGIGGSFSLAVRPTADDRDDHVLRQLVFFADYDKNGKGFLCDLHGYYFLTPGWKFTLGMDVTYIAIDGRTYDQTHDPLWDQDQSTDLKQFLFWGGLEYRF